MALATVNDLTDRYDERTVEQLVLDDGSQASFGSLAGNDRVQAALAGAEGAFRSSAQRGQRYLPGDIDALTGYALAFVLDIICALAMGRLLRVRLPEMTQEALEANAPGWVWAQEQLQALREGEQIIPGVTKAEAAGKPRGVTLGSDVEGISSAVRLFGFPGLGGGRRRQDGGGCW